MINASGSMNDMQPTEGATAKLQNFKSHETTLPDWPCKSDLQDFHQASQRK